jgi:phosphatidylglycerophosphate synthase
MVTDMEVRNRRPIQTRSKAWAIDLAERLAKSGLSPNQISVIGIGFAVVGALAMLSTRTTPSAPFLCGFLLLIAAVTVQLRLLCNMLDGLVAVEYGKKSRLGDLFNEVPDRIEDTLFLVTAGYASGSGLGITLGWLAAVLAVGTAYMRLLGGSLGFKQDFCGPVAKPQRMFLLTVTLLIAAIQIWASGDQTVLVYGLALILIGTGITLVRRLLRLVKVMNAG